MRNIPVLIVGGGPVGLSLALALARQNICSLLIERRPGITKYPRARSVNARTMELFRQWGNISELLKHEHPKEARRIIWAQSLQGEEIVRISMDDSDISSYSPTQVSLVAQDHVEAFLYNSLLNHQQAEVQFLKEFISLEQNEAGVIARILNRGNNKEEIIRAQYLIAADGAHSSIRKQLNINMHGNENLGQFCNIYCEMDISKWTKHRPFLGLFFTDPKLSGRLLAPVDGVNLWRINIRFTAENTREDFTNDYCINEIKQLVNIPDIPVNILNKNFWTMSARVANNYRNNRVFLVGDAAHQLPPTGGFGMNTGIQDAHNLAWKLAYVINKWVSDKLLDTYYEERAPIAEQNLKWSTENAMRYDEINKAINSNNKRKLKEKLFEQHKNFNYMGLDLGFIYHSTIIFSENVLHSKIDPSTYIPTTLPGSRAPHLYLVQNNIKISTLDLFEKHFVLLVGSKSSSWLSAINKLPHNLSSLLKVYMVADNGELVDPHRVWLNIYEITSLGAVLIRPDGHVAWRSKLEVESPCFVLRNVLNVVLKSNI